MSDGDAALEAGSLSGLATGKFEGSAVTEESEGGDGGGGIVREGSELMDAADASENVKFADYESYVDTAVAGLRAVFLSQEEAFREREGAADAELLRLLTNLQGGLVETVDDFLLTTVTVTAEGADELRRKCAACREATLATLAEARDAQRAEGRRLHAAMAEELCASFDRELEGHQGRMSGRLLAARDALGGRLADMRRAKETELRDKYALDRELLAEHKAIATHEAAAAVAAERARLAAEWEPLRARHEALRRSYELREYQLGRAREEAEALRGRLAVYEPAWAKEGERRDVHPDFAWRFLDESLLRTVVEVGRD